MPKNKAYSSEEKKKVLASFERGHTPTATSNKLGLPRAQVMQWFQLYKNEGKTAWSYRNDKDYNLRLKALECFKNGYGYKKTAATLKQPQSRMKYWLHLYKIDKLDFFTKGSISYKQYSEAFRADILERYKSTDLSKKAFCRLNNVTVSSFKFWLKKEALKQHTEESSVE